MYELCNNAGILFWKTDEFIFKFTKLTIFAYNRASIHYSQVEQMTCTKAGKSALVAYSQMNVFIFIDYIGSI